MTRTRYQTSRARAYAHAYNVYSAWQRLGWFGQIMVGAALLCVFELACAWAAYPWIERAVTT